MKLCIICGKPTRRIFHEERSIHVKCIPKKAKMHCYLCSKPIPSTKFVHPSCLDTLKRKELIPLEQQTKAQIRGSTHISEGVSLRNIRVV